MKNCRYNYFQVPQIFLKYNINKETSNSQDFEERFKSILEGIITLFLFH